MTLQSSGPISLGNVGSELGRTVGTTTSLGETAVRNLAAVASGAITLSNLYGKSSVTFTPEGGLSSASPVMLSDWAGGGAAASVRIQCSPSAVWSWTKIGSTAGITSVVNGGSATSILFSLPNNGYTIRQTNWNVSATAGGITRYWSVELINEGFV